MDAAPEARLLGEADAAFREVRSNQCSTQVSLYVQPHVDIIVAEAVSKIDKYLIIILTGGPHHLEIKLADITGSTDFTHPL